MADDFDDRSERHLASESTPANLRGKIHQILGNGFMLIDVFTNPHAGNELHYSASAMF